MKQQEINSHLEEITRLEKICKGLMDNNQKLRQKREEFYSWISQVHKNLLSKEESMLWVVSERVKKKFEEVFGT